MLTVFCTAPNVWSIFDSGGIPTVGIYTVDRIDYWRGMSVVDMSCLTNPTQSTSLPCTSLASPTQTHPSNRAHSLARPTCAPRPISVPKHPPHPLFRTFHTRTSAHPGSLEICSAVTDPGRRTQRMPSARTPSTTVLSTPPVQGPPSSTSGTRPPMSAITCEAHVGEGRPLRLALQA